MAFHVRQTKRSERDLDSILNWLNEVDAGETGARWFERLQEAIKSLNSLPRRCSLAPESSEFPFEVRQLIFGKKPHQYRILFTIEGDDVFVLSVRHGHRRNLKFH